MSAVVNSVQLYGGIDYELIKNKIIEKDYTAYPIAVLKGLLMIVPSGLVIYAASELALYGDCFIDVNGELVIV